MKVFIGLEIVSSYSRWFTHFASTGSIYGYNGSDLGMVQDGVVITVLHAELPPGQVLFEAVWGCFISKSQILQHPGDKEHSGSYTTGKVMQKTCSFGFDFILKYKLLAQVDKDSPG